MKTVLLFAIICCSLFISQAAIAQDEGLEQVKKDLMALNTEEELALKDGDCDKLLSLMADDISFYINGNPSPPKKMIKAFCEKIPRPFKDQSQNTLKIYPLSDNAGYIVRTREFDKNETTRVNETVTKIWHKIDGIWKMTHLQSTIKETAIKN